MMENQAPRAEVESPRADRKPDSPGRDGATPDGSVRARPTLEIRNLTTRFRTRGGIVNAVNDVSISVNKGEIVGIVGESGCGKSVTSLSVLRLVAAPGEIAGGSILLEGEDLLAKTDRQMLGVRGRDISMIFQEPMTSLNPVYTVGRQVSEALLVHNPAIGRAKAREESIKMFGLVGIPEPQTRFDSYPHQLSGGLRQRIMIAMALICKPKLVIADEPTTALGRDDRGPDPAPHAVAAEGDGGLRHADIA